MPRRYSLGVDGTETGLAVEASSEPTSVRGLKVARSNTTVPASTLLSEVPVRASRAFTVMLTPSGDR